MYLPDREANNALMAPLQFAADRHIFPPLPSTEFAMANDLSAWKPKRTWAECNTMMCGPGAPFETHHIVVGGLVYRMYKNVPPVRDFRSVGPQRSVTDPGRSEESEAILPGNGTEPCCSDVPCL